MSVVLHSLMNNFVVLAEECRTYLVYRGTIDYHYQDLFWGDHQSCCKLMVVEMCQIFYPQTLQLFQDISVYQWWMLRINPWVQNILVFLPRDCWHVLQVQNQNQIITHP